MASLLFIFCHGRDFKKKPWLTAHEELINSAWERWNKMLLKNVALLDSYVTRKT